MTVEERARLMAKELECPKHQGLLVSYLTNQLTEAVNQETTVLERKAKDLAFACLEANNHFNQDRKTICELNRVYEAVGRNRFWIERIIEENPLLGDRTDTTNSFQSYDLRSILLAFDAVSS